MLTLGQVERGSGAAPDKFSVRYVAPPAAEKANGGGKSSTDEEEDAKSQEQKLQEALRDTRLKVMKVRRSSVRAILYLYISA